jgi:mono/diheme cytochrome c family protein
MILLAAAGSFTLAGCGNDQFPAYSALVKYGVRQDPILMQPGAKLGDERYEPDRPGQFPIMKLDDITKPDHPLFSKSSEIIASGVMRDPTRLSAKDRDDLEKALEETFGTPANPKVGGVEPEIIAELKLDVKTLEEGSKRYRIHCLHCHGVPGDGRGPTARWINPHPRDFRQGIFKFQSVNQAADGITRTPHRSDLLRTLTNGLEGTAMPSFKLLENTAMEQEGDKVLDYLVSYVIHLAIRGKAEHDTIFYSFKKDGDALVFPAPQEEEDPANVAAAVKKWTMFAAKKWKESQDPAKAILVAPYPWDVNDIPALEASVKRGQLLFTGNPDHPRGKNANCVGCHTDYGRQAKFRFDDWATLVRPNNFAAGVFRGGKRPVDLYYRIHSGINGSGMANYGNPAVLQGTDIWDLVNFVSNLSYPGMRETLKININ